MDITNISPLRVQQNGNIWTFDADYTVTFRSDEIGGHFTFVDNAQLREEDDGADDVVVPWRGERPWKPTATKEHRSWRIRVSGDAVDTEWGGEEIYMQIGLRNVTTGSPGIVRRSPIVQVSPG